MILCRWSLLCGLALVIATGCNKQTGRFALKGTVTIDGNPLTDASISFRPVPGTSGPTAGGNITDGKFMIPSKGGPFAGTFRVEINASRKTGRQIRDPMLGTMVDEYQQSIPARYNQQSTLTSEVTAEGPNQFEFVLESK